MRIERSRVSTWVGSIAALVLGTSAAQAGVFRDVELPLGGYGLVSANNPYNFTMNVGPYNGEVVQNARLDVWLADDSTDLSESWSLFGFNIEWQSETASFRLDGATPIAGDHEVDGGMCLFGSGANTSCLSHYDLFSLNVPASAVADGVLGVQIRATTGDFWFKRAELTVNTARVPEPATLGLLGLGLVGMGMMRRRKNKAAA